MGLPQANKDKANHFIYGSGIFFVAMLTRYVLANKGIVDLHIIVPILFLLAWAVGKELLWDGLLKKGHVEFADAVWTFLPASWAVLTVI